MQEVPVHISPSATISTRRQAFAAIAVAIAAGSLDRTQAQEPTMVEKAATEANKSRTSIHYEIEFKPSPQRLYEAILDQK
jgi:hypothetical protein